MHGILTPELPLQVLRERNKFLADQKKREGSIKTVGSNSSPVKHSGARTAR